MKLKEILEKLAQRSGVNLNEEAIKKVLDNPTLATIEVDDVVSKQLTQEMLTIEAAKQNPELQKHFTAITLNGLDAELETTSTKLGLTDEDKLALKAEKSSYKRVGLLAEKIQALEAKKAGASNKDKDALSKDIEKLNADILTERTKYASEKQQLMNQFDGERTNWKLESVYGNFLPQMDEKNSAKVNLTIARTIVAEELQKRGYKVVNNQGNLSLLTSQDTEVFENNQKIDFQDFAQKTLANEKLLTVSKKTPQQTNQPAQRQTVNNSTELNVSKYLDAVDNNQ